MRLLLSALALAGSSLPARAATLEVCDDCAFSDLSSAIAAAEPGDTIALGPGTWTGSWEIAVPLTVVGPDARLEGHLEVTSDLTIRDLTLVRREGEVIRALGSALVLEDVAVSDLSDPGSYDPTAAVLAGCADVTLRRVTFDGVRATQVKAVQSTVRVEDSAFAGGGLGLHLLHSEGVLQDSTFSDFSGAGGVRAWNSGLRVERSRFERNGGYLRYGAYPQAALSFEASDGSSLRITRSTFRGNWWGWDADVVDCSSLVASTPGGAVAVERTEFTENPWGMCLDHTRSATLVANRWHDNWTWTPAIGALKIGAVGSLLVVGDVFSGNQGAAGGAASVLQVGHEGLHEWHNVVFSENESLVPFEVVQPEAGLRIRDSAPATVRQAAFLGNIATRAGALLAQSPAVLESSVVAYQRLAESSYGNAPAGPAVIGDVVAHDVLWWDNQGGHHGAAVRIEGAFREEDPGMHLTDLGWPLGLGGPVAGEAVVGPTGGPYAWVHEVSREAPLFLDTEPPPHPAHAYHVDGEPPSCPTGLCIDADGDGAWSSGSLHDWCPPAPVDCDDEDPNIHPGAVEQCNGIDEDCNGIPDADRDRDGHLACAGDCDDYDPSVVPVDLDGDGSSVCDGDCDETDPTVWGLDVDGDGGLDCFDCDDHDPSRSSYDADGDGDTTCATDCDDDDPDRDGLDRDHDGQSTCTGDCDDDDRYADSRDRDGDGYSTCDGDCDDGNPDWNPGAEDCPPKPTPADAEEASPAPASPRGCATVPAMPGLAGLLVLLTLIPRGGRAATLEVCEDCPFTDVGAAIAAAEAHDTVRIGPGTWTGSWDIAVPLTLVGTGDTRLHGLLEATADLTLRDLELVRDGRSVLRALRSRLVLEDVAVSDVSEAHASELPPAIVAGCSDVVLRRVAFGGVLATQVKVVEGTLAVEDSAFVDGGAAIDLLDSVGVVEASTFSTLGGRIGAIRARDSELHVDGSVFEDNAFHPHDRPPAAVVFDAADGSSLRVVRSVFRDNQVGLIPELALCAGVTASTPEGAVVIERSRFDGNSRGTCLDRVGSATLVANRYVGNGTFHAPVSALKLVDVGSLLVVGDVFLGNEAKAGGAAQVRTSGAAGVHEWHNVVFLHNVSRTPYGHPQPETGLVLRESAPATLSHAAFLSNRATSAGALLAESPAILQSGVVADHRPAEHDDPASPRPAVLGDVVARDVLWWDNDGGHHDLGVQLEGIHVEADPGLQPRSMGGWPLRIEVDPDSPVHRDGTALGPTGGPYAWVHELIRDDPLFVETQLPPHPAHAFHVDGAPPTCPAETCLDGDGDGAGAVGSLHDWCRIVEPDCDDDDGAVHPEAAEQCNGIDDDCSGAPDRNEQDEDGDGHAPCDGDCDDLDPTLGPWDRDGDGLGGCDGDCDDDDASIRGDDADGDGTPACSDCDDADPTRSLGDLDGDGDTTCGTDCDDGDPAGHGLDLDADGDTTCATDCDDHDPALHGLDLDADGYSTCDGDCDDLDPARTPADDSCIWIPPERQAQAAPTGCTTAPGSAGIGLLALVLLGLAIRRRTILVAAAVASVPAHAATLEVCEDCPFTDVGAAIEAAQAHDTIAIGPGTWTGSWEVPVPLTLEASDGTRLEGEIDAAADLVLRGGLLVGSIRAFGSRLELVDVEIRREPDSSWEPNVVAGCAEVFVRGAVLRGSRLRVLHGSARVEETAFTEASAGIDVVDGAAIVQGSSFVAVGGDSAVHVQNSDLTVERSLFADSRFSTWDREDPGAAVRFEAADGSSLRVVRSTFRGNFAGMDADLVACSGVLASTPTGAVFIERTRFEQSTWPLCLSEVGAATLVANRWRDNGTRGGAVGAARLDAVGSLLVVGDVFAGNHGSGGGAARAVEVGHDGIHEWHNVVFVDNVSMHGVGYRYPEAGLVLRDSAPATVSHAGFLYNHATGAGAFLAESPATLESSVVSDHSPPGLDPVPYPGPAVRGQVLASHIVWWDNHGGHRDAYVSLAGVQIEADPQVAVTDAAGWPLGFDLAPSSPLLRPDGQVLGPTGGPYAWVHELTLDDPLFVDTQPPRPRATSTSWRESRRPAPPRSASTPTATEPVARVPCTRGA